MGTIHRVAAPLFTVAFLLSSSIGLARELAPPAPAVSARADTLFLFAASGPGSYGSPGTDARGFTFDQGRTKSWYT